MQSLSTQSVQYLQRKLCTVCMVYGTYHITQVASCNSAVDTLLRDRVGKEVITRFTTGLKTNATWYTDANGREMKKRM